MQGYCPCARLRAMAFQMPPQTTTRTMMTITAKYEPLNDEYIC